LHLRFEDDDDLERGSTPKRATAKKQRRQAAVIPPFAVPFEEAVQRLMKVKPPKKVVTSPSQSSSDRATRTTK